MTHPSRQHLPLILIRGFGGLDVEDEKRLAYQGFNMGTVYPQKTGDNYIYEGFLLRLMKADWEYYDATNVVGYYPNEIPYQRSEIPDELADLDPEFFHGHKVVVDPGMALHIRRSAKDIRRTIWVFRYYDLSDRRFDVYVKALVRLIQFIRALSKQDPPPKVNIVAHSMGGLIVRAAIQGEHGFRDKSGEVINKIVTLGTPHRGITFQLLKSWMFLDASDELEAFYPMSREQEEKAPTSAANFKKFFPPERMLTVVGTDYRSFGVTIASWANRLFSAANEFGTNYNRSDGLVKQSNAQVPGCPRTFVHKCHGGDNSLLTSRESFEIATRFLFGDFRIRLRMLSGNVTRGLDWFGKSELFFGVSIKVRGVDFDLFHQSAEAENCYGPFHNTDFSDTDVAFAWADSDRLIWEGFLDSTKIFGPIERPIKDVVFRLDFYVGERDLYGIGFSDNVVFRKQYYVQAVVNGKVSAYLHPDERFTREKTTIAERQLTTDGKGWVFLIGGTGFEGKFRIELDRIPEVGPPVPYDNIE